ncbi:MAG: hypothetical protein Q8R47_01270 [Nanoarchaeota archaeon]|nr:hypothetical protein [Nanoarchaeota archaeon]
MQKMLSWIKRNNENIKSSIICLFLSFGVLFIAGKIIESIFIQGQAFNWFGFNSLSVQMRFCLHSTMIIFSSTALITGFLIDISLLRKRFSVVARMIFWLFLLVSILVKVIGHYKGLNSVGVLDVEIFQEMKFLLCY